MSTDQLVRNFETIEELASISDNIKPILGQSLPSHLREIGHNTQQFAQAVQWIRNGQTFLQKPIEYFNTAADMGQKLEASLEQNPIFTTFRTIKGFVKNVKEGIDFVNDITKQGHMILHEGKNMMDKLYPQNRRTQKKPKTLTEQIRQHHQFIRKDIPHHQVLNRDHRKLQDQLGHLQTDQGKNISESHGSNVFDHRVKGLSHAYHHVRLPHEFPLTRDFKTSTDATQSSSVFDMRPVLQIGDAPPSFHRQITVI
jgi:hypothetical protein